MAENQQDKALQAFRNEIDKIDDQIISLLQQRMEVISQVAELKKSNQEKFFIRSAREADMIKNLIKKAGPNFPQSLIVNIWRRIITAANMHEQPLRIAIHNPKNISDYEYLVREYYSDIVPVANFDSASSAVMELEKNAAQIAIFALPQNQYDEHDGKEDIKENWWITLANNHLGLRVFAKIPFIKNSSAFSSETRNHNAIELVAVAAKEPEKSNSDNSLLYVEVSKEISKGQLLSSLKEQGFVAKILKSAKIQQFDGVVFYLVELEGFYLENDPAITAFTKNKIKPFAKILGHFANFN